LLRLLTAEFASSKAETVPPESVQVGGLPPPDAEPLRVDGIEVPLVWRNQRIVAVEADSAAAARLADLEDHGLAVVILPSGGAARTAALEKLARQLEGA
jgi:hypothetical protein